MGVIYKLTEDPVQFILKLRQEDSAKSCRQLADEVGQRFGIHVSKSSVHDVLKEAGIVSARGRKPAKTFSIPSPKKELISLNISRALAPLMPELVNPPEQVQERTAPTILLNPAHHEEIAQGAGEVFLKAVFWDMCPQNILGIKSYDDLNSIKVNGLEQIWEYLTKPVAAIKVGLGDSSVYYLDARLAGVSRTIQGQGSLYAPIERALADATDLIVNNIRPLIIKEVGELKGPGLDLLASFCCVPGRKIQEISIVDKNDHNLCDLSQIVEQKRHFICKITCNMDEIKESLAFINAEQRASPVRLVKTEEMALLTNLSESHDVRMLYGQRHPACRGELKTTTDALEKIELPKGTDNPGQWVREQLKTRAKMILASKWQEEWPAVLDFPGSIEKTSSGITVTICPPKDYKRFEELSTAADLVNSWGLADDEGRRVFVQISCAPG